MQLADFHYNLPSELIARYPLKQRGASRLLELHPDGSLRHGQFSDLLHLVTEKDLLVFNKSRVIPARLKGKKASGGRVEILVERLLDQQRALVHLRASKTPVPGSYLHFDQGVDFQVLGRENHLFILQCLSEEPLLSLLERLGEIPLPPYLHRPAEESDKERYQTVYAEEKGSVAAPTAGLHFDQTMLENLRAKGARLAFLTLHVGAGTFLPVRTEQLLEHRLHPEYIEVSEELCEEVRKTKAQGGRVIAVGTTSARSLETASHSGQIQAYSGDTDLFIYPGYRFKTVDMLLTNFHLPESSLMMLVCALGGQKEVMQAYRSAVEKKYRFYSYGDAMLVKRTDNPYP